MSRQQLCESISPGNMRAGTRVRHLTLDAGDVVLHGGDHALVGVGLGDLEQSPPAASPVELLERADDGLEPGAPRPSSCARTQALLQTAGPRAHAGLPSGVRRAPRSQRYPLSVTQRCARSSRERRMGSFRWREGGPGDGEPDVYHGGPPPDGVLTAADGMATWCASDSATRSGVHLVRIVQRSAVDEIIDCWQDRSRLRIVEV